MSKKVLMLSVAVLFGMQAGLAMAANPDTGPGCGLGKLAWSDYAHQKNIGPQVLMATTNGTFGSRTFGISTRDLRLYERWEGHGRAQDDDVCSAQL